MMLEFLLKFGFDDANTFRVMYQGIFFVNSDLITPTNSLLTLSHLLLGMSIEAQMVIYEATFM